MIMIKFVLILLVISFLAFFNEVIVSLFLTVFKFACAKISVQILLQLLVVGLFSYLVRQMLSEKVIKNAFNEKPLSCFAQFLTHVVLFSFLLSMVNSVFTFTDQGYVWIATRILLINFCVVYIRPPMISYVKKHFNIVGSIVLLLTLSVGIILLFPTDLISLLLALLIGITYADTPPVNPVAVNAVAVNPVAVNPVAVNPPAGNAPNVNPAVGNSAVAQPVIYSSTSFVPIPHAIDNILTPTLVLFNTGQLRIPQSVDGDVMLTALLRWMTARMHDVGDMEWAALAMDHYSGSDVKVAKLLCSARLRHLEYLLSHNSGGVGAPTDIVITGLTFDDNCLTNLQNILTNIKANNLQQGLIRDTDTSSAASTNESSDDEDRRNTDTSNSDASTTSALESDDSEPSVSSRHSVGFANLPKRQRNG